MIKKNKVAFVQYVLVHYREPIFKLLCQQHEPEYTFFSDKINTHSTVKVIDQNKADLPIEQGGLRWRFVKNTFIRNWLWQSGVVRLSLSKEFDTIIYEGSVYILSTWIGSFFARLKGKRVLMWTQGVLRDEKGLKGWIRKLFYRLADGLLLYHNRAREILIKKGFKPENLYVVYNSLDYDTQKKRRDQITDEDLSACRKGLFEEPELPVLLFIGRLTPQKKLQMIVEAASILKDQGCRCNVLFVGDGSERDYLAQLSKQAGLEDNLCFYGECYDEDKIALLIKSSDICVAPGEIGLTCMHSLVYGTPVITHNDPDYQGPEYEAITPGYNGNFFEKDDTQDLASTIGKWLDEIEDRNTISRQCYEVIDEFYNPHYQVKVVNAAVFNSGVDYKD